MCTANRSILISPRFLNALTPYAVNHSKRKILRFSWIDQYSCKMYPVKIMIMLLCSSVWPHKTDMHLWMFFSKLQFISITAKLFHLKWLSICGNHYNCEVIHQYFPLQYLVVEIPAILQCMCELPKGAIHANNGHFTIIWSLWQ